MKFLLVGTAFTPGAVALVAKGLPQGAEVELRAEPENPYDAYAVRALVARSEIRPNDVLTEALAGFGLSLDSIAWPLQLGHLGAKAETKAAKAAIAAGHQFDLCAKWHGAAGGGPLKGRLIQHGNGTNIIETA